MGVRDMTVLISAWCIGCGPKGAPPSTEPTAHQPAVEASEQELESDEEETEELEETEDEGAQDPEPEDPTGPLTFKLHNLCKRPVKYGLGPLVREIEFAELKTIKARGVEQITVERGIGVHLGEGEAYAAAAPKVDGGHVWITSSCKGVSSSDDPNADPEQLDRELREKIERMTKSAQ